MFMRRLAIMVFVLAFSTSLFAQSTGQRVQNGSLSVSSMPSGAQVFLNNVNRGVTPLTISQLQPRTYSVTLKKTDYKDWKGNVTIMSGKQSHLSRVLVSIYGTLNVTSNPPGAQVFLNNANKGVTPLTINRLSAGTYSVILRKTGYQDWTGSVAIRSGAQSNLSQSLIIIPTHGTLSISSNPPGAQIFLDDVSQGAKVTPSVIGELSAGSHNVKLQKQGYQDWVGSVTIIAGQQSNLSQNLVSAHGSFYIQSNPSGADIVLTSTGANLGKTPKLVNMLTPGSYGVDLEKSGYERNRVLVTVRGGVQTDVPVVTLIPTLPPSRFMEIPPGTHRVQIASNPPGATVVFRGIVQSGTTPLTLSFRPLFGYPYEFVLRQGDTEKKFVKHFFYSPTQWTPNTLCFVMDPSLGSECAP